MVKVLRCPACGALWRIDPDQSSALLRCSECHSVFSTDKAESVLVDDQLLNSRLDKGTTEAEILQQKAEEADITLSNLARELSDLSEEQPEDAKETTESKTPEQPEVSASKSPSPLWGLVILVALLILICVGLLAGHQTVLRSAPQLRGVYENVCTKLPCPGFVWMNGDAFSVTATLENPAENGTDLDREMAALMPVVVAKLQNNSVRPQYLPILELKLFDAAGETMAQRILEPEEYGFAQNAAVSPGESVTAKMTILTPLPYQAHGVTVTPISDPR